MKFVIEASSYNPDIGGIIALHKLCHCLNEVGEKAYLQPVARNSFAAARRGYHFLSWRIPLLRRLTGKGFEVNPALNTPLLPFGFDPDPQETITIYPEAIDGNPLSARHIVRWFLHKPGFHTGWTSFGSGEFHIDFNEFLTGYDPGANHLSPDTLYVVHFPLDIYNMQGAVPPDERTGVAYCVRKGTVDPAVDLSGAVCVDGLSHAEIAEVLKRVKYFYSFDPYTAYSQLAVLCGAVSVVIPPPDMNRQSWYQKEVDRYGVAFGLDDLDWTLSTRDMVLPTLREREAASLDAVRRFVDEATSFFGMDRQEQQGRVNGARRN